MKKIFLKCKIIISIMFLANLTFAQDMIILKTGDEIKSKVLEITPDIVKYKKWDNQDGPTYSSNKSEIFMIKYSNGTKDIFKDILKTDKISDAYLKFEGVWKPIGTSRNQPITIKRSGDNFIVQTPIYDAGDGHYRGDQKQPASYIIEHDKLEVSSSFGKMDIIYDSNSKHLIFDGIELKKITDSFSSLNASSSTQPNNVSSDTGLKKQTSDLYKRISVYTINSNNSEENAQFMTTPRGYFYNLVPEKDKFGGMYYFANPVYSNETNDESIYKHILIRTNTLSLPKAKFGKQEKYENDELTIKKEDSLFLSLTISGNDLLKYDYKKSYWIGEGLYYFYIAVTDSTYQIQYENSVVKSVKTKDKELRIAQRFDELIEIAPEIVQKFPVSQNLYLNFAIQSIDKKHTMEGLLRFKVVP